MPKRILVERGSSEGVGRLPLSDPALPSLVGDVATGDLDGDGYADLLLTAHVSGPSAIGLAWVLPGPFPPGVLDPTMATVTIPDLNSFSTQGTAVIGDMDGNGMQDVALEDWDDSLPLGASKSSVEVYYQPSGTAAPDLVIRDAQYGPQNIDCPGDVDGDGLADLLLGSREVLDSKGVVSGGAYLILGVATGF
jgi:hypothetical protein